MMYFAGLSQSQIAEKTGTPLGTVKSRTLARHAPHAWRARGGRTMTLDHSRIEELMAVDALGGLDGDDVALLERERAAHGDCAECRALEAGFAETAGRLAFALTPAPVDDSMIDAILAQPQDRRGGGARVDLDRPHDQLAERRARRARAAGRRWSPPLPSWR